MSAASRTRDSNAHSARWGPSVLVLGGGPDAEREVSLISSAAVAAALRENGHPVFYERIEKITMQQLRAMAGDVVFPVLHGGWGEGGPLQELLEADGRPFVGSGSHAARHAMDKIATKFTAACLGIPTPQVRVLDIRDDSCPLPLPVVIKPVHEGSTLGLHVVRAPANWIKARDTIRRELDTRGEIDSVGCEGMERAGRAARPTAPGAIGVGGGLGVRVYMIEPLVGADHAAENGPAVGNDRAARRGFREITVGLVDDLALPVIEIVPVEGLYDYNAKYFSDETKYLVGAELPPGVAQRVQHQTRDLARAMGCRHVARADFLLDDAGTAWFLEINTMPGFTGHSLVPMAAAHPVAQGGPGLSMPDLCTRLVALALRDHGRRT